MTLSDVGRYAFVAGLAAALLAGCSGSQSSRPAGGEFNPAIASSTRSEMPAEPDTRESWIAPDIAKSQRLLFVTDAGLWDVYIYSIPSLTLKAVLTGFKAPAGECSDASGNVWVANTGTRQMIELSHAGSVLKKIKDDDGYPWSCAVNASTGDLAVTNIEGLDGSGSMGGIDLYAGARGKPTKYINPLMTSYVFDGYDPRGNLYVDGEDDAGNFMLSELPKSAKAARTITVSGGVIYFPGLVQWDSKTNQLAVGDRKCNGVSPGSACVYLLSMSRSEGMISETTRVKVQCDLADGVLSGDDKTLYGSDNLEDFDCDPLGNSYTHSWRFPAGRRPTESNNVVDKGPVGAAVSAK